jgi:hypothetical protein
MDRVKTFLVKSWTWCILHGFEKRKKKKKKRNGQQTYG